MADESFVLRCGHCGNTTAFYERAEYHYDERMYDNDNDGNPIYWGHYVVKRVEWRILQCPACKNPTLHQLLGPGDEHGGWDDEPYETVLYPVEKVISKDIPKDIATVYSEALQMAPLSPSACAVMMGRTLEVICRHEGAVDGTLHARLQQLATSGRIPETFGKMALQLKEIRNLGAHVESGGNEVNASDVPVILEFMDAILEYLYVAQAKIAALESRPNRKGKVTGESNV